MSEPSMVSLSVGTCVQLEGAARYGWIQRPCVAAVLRGLRGQVVLVESGVEIVAGANRGAARHRVLFDGGSHPAGRLANKPLERPA